MLSQKQRTDVFFIDPAGMEQTLADGLCRAGMRCRSVPHFDDLPQTVADDTRCALVANVDDFERICADRAWRTGADEYRPIVLLTPYNGADPLIRALRLGADELLIEPVTSEQLLQSLRVLIEEDGPGPLHLRAAEAVNLQEQAHVVSLAGIRALIKAVEAKDPWTRRHSEHVGRLSERIATLAGTSSARVESIQVAALLHDVGKIGVPDYVLTKHGRLSHEEKLIIQAHAEVGAEIIENISVFRPEAKSVRHHHENWDGSGYPDGLAGEDIPLGARVIRIADALDAMLSDRSYREALSPEHVAAVIETLAGRHFDPRLVEVVLRDVLPVFESWA